MSARCPHCQTELPEAATFCAACGRRIEGWSGVPAAAPSPLPGGDEPTRQVDPSPSLLRAVAVSKAPRPEPKGETDSAILRSVHKPRVPAWVWIACAGAAAAAVAYRVTLHGPSSSSSAAPPAAVTIPPSVPLTQPPEATPLRPRPAPPATTPPPADKAPPPHAALPQKSGAHKPFAPTGSSGLPHKATTTDSKSAVPVAAPAVAAPATRPAAAPAAPPPVLTPEELNSEAPALTEEEQKRQSSAAFDAGSVRLVVKQHLAQVHACYERAFKDSSPGGRVEVAFSVTGAGRASHVRVHFNSTPSEALGQCLESRVREWQFPRPMNGDVELIYPFVFSPGS